MSTIASAMAYLASVLVIDALLRGPKTPLVPAPRRPVTAGSAAAGGCALACLLLIPPGSLPAPCNAAWGAVAWLALFCASALCSKPAETECSGPKAGGDAPQSGRIKELPAGNGRAGNIAIQTALAGTAIALIAWCAWRRGVPGSPLNFGTYAAMPFWELQGPLGNAGFFLLFSGLFLARPGSGTGTPAFFDARMRRLGWCCFLSAVFVPNPMAAFQASALWTVAGDYLFFWAAAVLLFRLPVPERWGRSPRPAVLCCLAGGALLLAALHGATGAFFANGI